MRLTFDNSPPDGSPGVLLGFLEGRHARQLGRDAAGGAARRRGGLLRAAASARAPPGPMPTSSGSGPRRSGRAGATAATCRPGPGPNYGPALREPIGPLHWAGAEIATVWNGYMDGAVRSGETAATEVLARLV